MTGFSRAAVDVAPQAAAVVDIDLDNAVAIMVTRGNTQLRVQLNWMIGNTLIYPEIGEQWFIERIGIDWRLKSRLPFQDEKLTVAAVAGSTHIGSTGPTHIYGPEAYLPNGVWIGTSKVRSDPTTGALLRLTESGWIPVGPATGTVPFAETLVHSTGTRAAGLGVQPDGWVLGVATLTKVVFQFGTVDTGGTATIQLRRPGGLLANIDVSAANQVNSAGTLAARTVVLDYTTLDTDNLTVTVVGITGTAGARLSAHVYGTRKVTFA